MVTQLNETLFGTLNYYDGFVSCSETKIFNFGRRVEKPSEKSRNSS